jgi:hypothetical protein
MELTSLYKYNERIDGTKLHVKHLFLMFSLVLGRFYLILNPLRQVIGMRFEVRLEVGFQE